jgi:hypothetical protein
MKSIKLLFLFPVLTVSLLITSSCSTCIDGQGEVGKQNRKLDKFEKLDISVPADITIKKGNSFTMMIEAQKNIAGAIKSKVKRGTLHLTSSCFNTEKRVKIEITANTIKEISVSGSARVKNYNVLNTDKAELSLSGSGKIETDVLTPETYVKIDGSGTIIVNGNTKKLNAIVEGSGKLMALGLRTKEAFAEINGSGKIFTGAEELLKAKISGSGIIQYTGSPKVRTKIDGTGKVSKID